MKKLTNLIGVLLLCSVCIANAMRDPTAPPVDEFAKQVIGEDKRFIIHGILHGSGRHYVIINNRILTVGDTIDSAKVLKIADDYVQLLDGDNVIQITLYKKIKEPAAVKSGPSGSKK